MGRNDSLLDGEFELSGAWWLPESPDNQIRGTLHFKGGDKILLNLHGAFQEWPQTEFLRPPVILGLSEDRGYCTLLENTQASAKPSLTTDLQRSSFVCTRLLVGAAFTRESDILFTSMRFRFSYLEEWVGGIPAEVEFFTEQSEPWSVRFPYGAKQIFSVNLPRREASLSVHSGIGKYASRSEISCKHECSVVLTPTDPRPLAWFDEQRQVLEQLMTLLVGEPVYPVAASGLLKVLDEKGQRSKESAKLYLSLIRPRIRNLLEPQMLLPWRRAPNEIPQIVEQWYDKADSLEPVHTLFFATRYNPSTYVESEFLMLVQALESFHRCTSPGTYVSEDRYKTYADRMLRALPQEISAPLRDRLANYIPYGNEFSLRKRLQELFSHLPDAARPKLFKKESEFIELIVETRNHLAHPRSGPRDRALSDVMEYLGTNLTLTQILTLLLFQSVGVSETKIDLSRLFHF